MGVETQTQELVQAKAPPVPFKLAYKFVLFFLVIYFARPEDWIPGVHYLHLAKVLGIVAILAFLGELGSARGKWPREVVYLFMLLGQMFLGVPFSPIWKGGAFNTTRNFANVVPMMLVICLAVNAVPRLRKILFWHVASAAVIAAVAVVKFRQAGGRLEGVLNGDYSNPNDFALMLVIALPICLAFMLRSRNNLVKLIWLGCFGVMTYAVVLSASRSGTLAYAVAMAFALWQFSIKGRHRYLLVVFGALAVCALVAGGSGLKKRYEAMVNPELDQSAYGSAQQRRFLLEKSISFTFKYPIFGIGAGDFNSASGVWRVTHNTYTEMSSETGLPGFILYMMILWCAWKNLRLAKRMIRGETELSIFAIALQSSLMGFLVGSFFASDGYMYFTYFLIAYTTAAYQIAKTQARRTISAAQPRETQRKLSEQAKEPAWSVS
jgi:O-antigen ligase